MPYSTIGITFLKTQRVVIRPPAYQKGGRGFESLNAHHTQYFNRFPKIESRAQSSEVLSINSSEHKRCMLISESVDFTPQAHGDFGRWGLFYF